MVGEVRGTLPGQLSKWPVFSLIIAIPRKGRRVRTVAIPGWEKQGINAWMTAAGAEDWGLLRVVSRARKVKEVDHPYFVAELDNHHLARI